MFLVSCHKLVIRMTKQGALPDIVRKVISRMVFCHKNIFEKYGIHLEHIVNGIVLC